MSQAAPSDLQLALELCDDADRITTLAFARTDLFVETKADRSPVTEADRGVELAVRDRLQTCSPDDYVLGEEYGQVGRADSGGRRWIIDPIDGTANFVRHLPFWATLLALEVDGELAVGVVSAPALGRRWWAGRGMGAFTTSGMEATPRRLSVSSIEHLGDAYVLGASLNYWDEAGRSPTGWLNLASQAHWDRSVGDFWTHMLVAEGSAEIGVDPIGKLWDLAALQVIVEEAGGRFTDLAGVARADGGNGVSSNGRLHETALQFLG